MKKLIVVLFMSALFFLLSGFYLQTEIHKLDKAHQQYKEDEVQIGEAYNQLSDLYSECQNYLQTIDTIHRYSIEYNIRPEIILAVMKLESDFDETATNGKHIGIMQIDEANFKSRMEGLGFESNIECGASLLSSLQSESSDLNYILNSYNMGVTGYHNYVKYTGEVSREYSRKGIQIIKNLEKEKLK